MLFLNPYLLLGLLGIAIPVIIHLFNRRNAREVKWGAMRFLLDSLMSRRRSLLLEEMLLLAARCLLAGCAVLAMARPFVPAGSSFPWWAVLPLGLLGIVLFGMSFALGRYRTWQFLTWLACLLCLALSAGAILLEKRLSLNRFVGGTARDIALVIDGSSSMTLSVDGETNFSRALKEAARLVEEAPRGVAFSVIVAGAVPDPLVPAPVPDRKYVQTALEQAIPVQGVLRVPDALAAAAASLVQGSHLTKQIILIGDGQSIGWQTGDLESWGFLNEAFARLPAKPRVFVRTLELPQGIRNLTLKNVAFSRPVVGTDRDVRVDVTLANTGREAVTPANVTLSAGGKEKIDRSVGQMAPGTERVVSFLHRFDTPGAQVVEARVASEDEMASDDSMRRVMQIMRTLKVLVADDGRAVRLLDRAGGYVALGLMPSAKGLQERETRKGREPLRPRYLMEPELIAASGLGLKRTLAGYAVTVLADVPSLPETQAAQLSEYVRLGGSLLVVHGARSDAAFYNGWQSAGSPVLPLPLGECVVAGQTGVKIDPGTFKHPALALFRESGDLADAVVECYRQARETNDVSGVVARLQNGAAFMAEQALGKGRVVQLFVPLDRTAGNLVARQSFLPLIQEVTSYLAQPVIASLNIPPSRGAVVQLASPALTQMSGSGLFAEYFKKDNFKKVLLTRIDPTLDLTWNENSPAEGLPRDYFTVRWTGSFVPKRSGTYTFYVNADDRLTLRIGAHEVRMTDYGQQREMRGTFKAGERYPLSAEFGEDSGQAGVWVDMEGPDFPRARLPGDWLVPVRGDADSWADAVDTQVLAPGGRTLFAKIRYGEDGLALRTDSPLMQGLYEVRVPAAAASWLGHLANTNDVFPLCVMENPEESKLDALTADEQAIVARHSDVTLTHSFEDLQKALVGKTFGRELWRIPAMVLFVLLILESVLTRWICVQRKTGENEMRS
ncbi:MAG TPA: PA14 domain-containing protein [Kiritimatiellia bacterium]|nr:PA14 domain-containing protein [Kiritimatiellia bacterium]HPS08699.1 PA14 domain-containing protein [Kiritimatiellia bacterium]